jgi:hypothetical protein
MMKNNNVRLLIMKFLGSNVQSKQREQQLCWESYKKDLVLRKYS